MYEIQPIRTTRIVHLTRLPHRKIYRDNRMIKVGQIGYILHIQQL